jgi:hypothetical protein
MDEIAALVAGGADLNATGDLGNTPLHILAREWSISRQEKRI